MFYHTGFKLIYTGVYAIRDGTYQKLVAKREFMNSNTNDFPSYFDSSICMGPSLQDPT